MHSIYLCSQATGASATGNTQWAVRHRRCQYPKSDLFTVCLDLHFLLLNERSQILGKSKSYNLSATT